MFLLRCKESHKELQIWINLFTAVKSTHPRLLYIPLFHQQFNVFISMKHQKYLLPKKKVEKKISLKSRDTHSLAKTNFLLFLLAGFRKESVITKNQPSSSTGSQRRQLKTEPAWFVHTNKFDAVITWHPIELMQIKNTLA